MNLEDVTKLQPGERWPPELACRRNSSHNFIQCDSHLRGRQFVVWIGGQPKGKFLNRPDSALKRYMRETK